MWESKRRSHLFGYVFKVKNDSSFNELSIDVRNVAIDKPNLAVLSQIDESALAVKDHPGCETYLRVIAKSGSNSSGLIVPMRSEAKKETPSKGASQ